MSCKNCCDCSKKRKIDEHEVVLENSAKIYIKKLSEHAFIPKRETEGSAGMDLRSAYDEIIPPNSRKLVKTDLAIRVPKDCYGRVAPRSGLAIKHFIDVGAGVVDSDYRGNLGVVMFNFGEKEFVIKKGDRIAQLILERIYIPEVVEVEELDETSRGAGGFGSTGVN
ncbi:deoxyuridine 5'-triphosphate nucleotidohydrolase [Anaeromyces robustus]|uniref:Deoxyuridine 5'-triphosphate nucleotidohydrolase n=1 Tax=Anaeromyces robustus TaxID=1754192 RepID=A0A1Y1WY39_9FUNG|nr:deoxyuridine 5'-triphosphate nucleotidohydrolase [Anaeromyces robustus]|eukprot:ORX78238.1 deoxyuridine 5'-triphosphate nucleotidohydrolase [Anaeromyces robustus]